MTTTSNIFAIVIVFLTLYSCKKEQNSSESNIKVKDISFTKEGKLQILRDKDTIKQLTIEIADNPYERETGLMYRKKLHTDQGMLFISEETKPQNFYMKNTLIALDIIYIGEDQKIVSFQKNTIPLDETSLPSVVPAKYILEVNAGLATKWQLQVGDSISFKKL
ncbi:DUF192 domain-containing protein [Aquimarina sp. W85]|uniref:DUF192 domain-containing protein n=1 Tax=Aquimarina rhodophyticola TaxID=3342246 RepID=UPI00366D8634